MPQGFGLLSTIIAQRFNQAKGLWPGEQKPAGKVIPVPTPALEHEAQLDGVCHGQEAESVR